MGEYINISNQPSSKLSRVTNQGSTSLRRYHRYLRGLAPEASTSEITRLAEEYIQKIETHQLAAVMVQGEFTFSYALIKRLREKNITVVAACTKRVVEEQTMPDGTVKKTVSLNSADSENMNRRAMR